MSDSAAAIWSSPGPGQPGRFSVPFFPTLALVMTLAFALAWAAAGSGEPVNAPMAVVYKCIMCAWMPLVYLGAAYGLGRWMIRWIAPSVESRTLGMCAGLAIMLAVSHGLGWAGLLGGAGGPVVAWIVVVGGLALAAKDLAAWWESSKTAERPSRWWLLVTPALGLMLTSACSAPGWLWSSEFGGFDVLSYHLQLPQEWLANGRIAPLQHNVYSYLPSSMEAAFMHVGVLGFPERTMTETDWGVGLLDRDGQGAIAAQMLHAMIGALAALGVGHATTLLVRRACDGGLIRHDNPHLASSAGGALAACVTAWTPWTIVTGSLAYNEMVLLLMSAGLLIVVLARDVSAARRWGIAALLVGGACSAKPTAILFLGIPAGIVLLCITARREWLRAGAVGVGVGALTLAPWMIRNAVQSGNPVFPFAAGVFANAQGGTGHWSAEQVSRFSRAHSFEGSFGQRLAASVLAQPDAGDPQKVVHRGVMHPQWGWFFPLVAICAVGILPRWRAMGSVGRTAAGMVIGCVVVQLGLWLFTTHVQARFLLPLLPAGAAIMGLCVGLVDLGNLRAGAIVVLVGLQALATYNMLGREHQAGPDQGGVPFGAVTAGTGDFTGEVYARGRPTLEAILGPDQWMNLSLKPETRVLMLGDATPLYRRQRMTYATTWDTHPLAPVAAEKPDDVSAWSIALREAGYDFVLVNLAELSRYDSSGWLDPQLSRGSIERWVQDSTVAANAWPATGTLLVRPLLPAEKVQLDEQLRKAREQQQAAPQQQAPVTPPPQDPGVTPTPVPAPPR